MLTRGALLPFGRRYLNPRISLIEAVKAFQYSHGDGTVAGSVQGRMEAPINFPPGRNHSFF